MIKQALIGKEIVVTTANRIGVLAEVSALLTTRGINIEGVAGYAANGEAKIMIVTNDSTRAVEALHKASFSSVQEKDVIILELEDKPGALKGVTEALAQAKIDIRYIYGSACRGGCPARLILATADDQKAHIIFKKMERA